MTICQAEGESVGRAVGEARGCDVGGVDGVSFECEAERGIEERDGVKVENLVAPQV